VPKILAEILHPPLPSIRKSIHKIYRTIYIVLYHLSIRRFSWAKITGPERQEKGGQTPKGTPKGKGTDPKSGDKGIERGAKIGEEEEGDETRARANAKKRGQTPKGTPRRNPQEQGDRPQKAEKRRTET
jgi:hypothetical protein